MKKLSFIVSFIMLLTCVLTVTSFAATETITWGIQNFGYTSYAEIDGENEVYYNVPGI
ncbi:MAG: hypothetical protein ACOX31_05630 [Eubacteriales bacterium]